MFAGLLPGKLGVHGRSPPDERGIGDSCRAARGVLQAGERAQKILFSPSDYKTIKKRVLFICIHNSARSRMAEAFVNEHCGEEFAAESAGLEPGSLNPYAVRAMSEVGIDISRQPTRSVFDVFRASQVFAYVITVCDEASAERCPIFAGVTRRLHWSFPDPSAATGTESEKMEEARRVRDLVKAQIEAWCAETCELSDAFR